MQTFYIMIILENCHMMIIQVDEVFAYDLMRLMDGKVPDVNVTSDDGCNDDHVISGLTMETSSDIMASLQQVCTGSVIMCMCIYLVTHFISPPSDILNFVVRRIYVFWRLQFHVD